MTNKKSPFIVKKFHKESNDNKIDDLFQKLKTLHVQLNSLLKFSKKQCFWKVENRLRNPHKSSKIYWSLLKRF